MTGQKIKPFLLFMSLTFADLLTGMGFHSKIYPANPCSLELPDLTNVLIVILHARFSLYPPYEYS